MVAIAWMVAIAGCSSSSDRSTEGVGPAVGTASKDLTDGVAGEEQRVVDLGTGEATIVVPPDSLSEELAAVPIDDLRRPPAPPGAVFLGAAMELTAGGQQPRVPLTLRIPAADLDPTDPSLVFFARWDDEATAWVPYRTTYDPATGVITATIDHFTILAPVEWIGGVIADGLEWTGQQLQNAYDSVTGAIGSTVQAIKDDLELFGTNVAGWLGIRGASPPTCAASDRTDVELTNSADGNQPPFFACHEWLGDTLRVKIANNRPYGMIVSRPPGSRVTIENWPGLQLTSGDAALYAFYEVLDSGFGIDEAYLPPGATLAVDFIDQPPEWTRIEATSSTIYVGLDLGIEWLFYIYGTGVELPVDGINCLLAGGSSLSDIVNNFDPGELFRYADAVRQCLSTFLGDAALGTFDVVKSSVAAVPALLSTIKDVGGSGQVENSLTIRYRADAPPAGVAVAPGELAGVWVGPVDQPGAQPYTMTLTLSPDGDGYRGTVDYPELACGGFSTLLGRDGATFQFAETITYGDRCIDGTFTLAALTDGRLAWDWTSEPYVATALLERARSGADEGAKPAAACADAARRLLEEANDGTSTNSVRTEFDQTLSSIRGSYGPFSLERLECRQGSAFDPPTPDDSTVITNAQGWHIALHMRETAPGQWELIAIVEIGGGL
ncbi:MAG: hypothetical protein AAF547_02445 [Actinomycetota bacterium]